MAGTPWSSKEVEVLQDAILEKGKGQNGKMTAEDWEQVADIVNVQAGGHRSGASCRQKAYDDEERAPRPNNCSTPDITPISTTKKPRSLAHFFRDQKRSDCPVCKLPVQVRGQLAEAGTRKIPRNMQLAWLREDFGVNITDSEISHHNAGRHDAEA